MNEQFNAKSVLLRWLLALFGVYATYNPSGYSYYHWILRQEGLVSLRVLVGIALAIFYIIYLRATFRSLGLIGMGLVTALCGSIAWLLSQWRILDLDVPHQQTMVSLAVTASVLGIGMSWSAIRSRISGQVDSEDVGAEPLV